MDDYSALHPPRQRRVGRQTLPRVHVGHRQVLTEAGQTVLLKWNRHVEIIKASEAIRRYRGSGPGRDGSNGVGAWTIQA